ncbi:hypothetical protein VTK56DRAFT_6153 [Thermocarpiscus australiensis]
MSSLLRLVAATLALAVGVLSRAFPPSSGTSNPGQHGTVSLTQVRNSNFVRKGPVELARIYNKYGRPLPDDLKAAVARVLGKRSTGSEVTTPETYDSEYLTPVSIGTPAQVLNLDLDTGSSDLWVFSSLTPRSQVSGQAIYCPRKSFTARELQGYTWSISYGDGSSSSGDVYLDTVTLGNLTVSSQAIGVAREVSSQLTADRNNHGLLGLAFGELNTVKPVRQKTFLENVMPHLDSPVFTADLKAGAPGHYNFGYIDSSAYTGKITYVPVDSSQGWWNWTSSGYAVGAGCFKRAAITGIADTGTSLLVLPLPVVSAYYEQVSGAKYDSYEGAYVLPCSGTPPDFIFGVGDHEATITVPGSYIKYCPTGLSGVSCFGGDSSRHRHWFLCLWRRGAQSGLRGL